MRTFLFISVLVVTVFTGCQRSTPATRPTTASSPQASAASHSSAETPPAEPALPPTENPSEKDAPPTEKDSSPLPKGEASAEKSGPGESAKTDNNEKEPVAGKTELASKDSASPTENSGQPRPATSDALATNADTGNPDTKTTVAATSKVSTTADKEKNESTQRVLLLAPGGPLVVDLVLQFGKSDFATALDRLVNDAFRVADPDGDGKATWVEVAENPRFRSGEFGNLAAETEEERSQLIRIYDVDRDGLVDRDELPRFLTRNVGGGRSFSLRSSNQYRGSNRRRSPTRMLLDTDPDGAISSEEMEAAPARLLHRDADDDDVVVLAELKDQAEEMMVQNPSMSNKRRISEPDTAVWMTDKSVDMSKRWGMVQFQLQELYSYGETIGNADWPMTPDLFRLLDADHDGKLAKSELTKLLDVPPHLVLDVMFDVDDEKDRRPKLKIRQIASELAVLKPDVREYPVRISMALPSVEIEFFINEDPALTNASQAVDAQFMALDRNQNGYLEKEEIPEMVPGFEASFESLDADKDGKIQKPELLAYVEQRSAVTRAQVRARAADQEDALFTALDTDGDGRLNAREIRLTPAKLKAMDANADGKLQSHEISGSMVLAFVRGNPQQDDQFFAYPSSAGPGTDESTPRWFRGMDANQDAEISLREFFGSRAQFEQYDTDQDGFILREEAKAVAPPK